MSLRVFKNISLSLLYLLLRVLNSIFFFKVTEVTSTARQNAETANTNLRRYELITALGCNPINDKLDQFLYLTFPHAPCTNI